MWMTPRQRRARAAPHASRCRTRPQRSGARDPLGVAGAGTARCGGCYRAVVGVTSAEPPTFGEPVVGAGSGVVISVAL